MNIENIASEIGIDTKTLLQLFKLFIEQTTVDLNRIDSAAAGKNWDVLKKSAHSIKGAALNLELEEIAGTAKALEQKAGAEDTEAMEPLVQSLGGQVAELQKVLAGL